MSQNFQSGDFLVFQLEAGFALLRLLEVSQDGEQKTWHVAAYRDFYPDVDTAETTCADPSRMVISDPHIALTNRAFESTQVARIANRSLTADEVRSLVEWKSDPNREVSDRSVRLMLGLR